MSNNLIIIAPKEKYYANNISELAGILSRWFKNSGCIAQEMASSVNYSDYQSVGWNGMFYAYQNGSVVTVGYTRSIHCYHRIARIQMNF